MTSIPYLSNKTERLVNDPFDRSVYFERGKWFTESTLPISEYPQIPTFLFGINHLTSMWLDEYLQLGAYIAFFSLGMLIVLFLFAKTLLELLPTNFENYIFLVLLPPTIYFSYNRFDILPAYFCLLAYSAATRRQWITTSILLALGMFTKWYPVLLFPGFFMYAQSRESKFQWNMIVAFGATSFLIVLLTWLYGGTETVIAPYQFHAARGMEQAALPVILDNLIRSLWGSHINASLFFLIFFLLQLIAPILIFLVKIDSLDALIDYSIVTIGFFIFFSRIWSPQWFLWLLPFLILSAKNWRMFWLIVVYNTVTYISFPFIYDRYGSTSIQVIISSMLIYLILFLVILRSIMNLRQGPIVGQSVQPT